MSNSEILVNTIRMALGSEGDEFGKITIPKQLNNAYNPKISQFYITLFQEDLKPIRWGSRRKDVYTTLVRIIEKLKENKNFHRFEVDNRLKCRIMLEMVTEEQEIKLEELTTSSFISTRFEPGITGFIVEYNKKRYYIMPNDAIVHSIMSFRQMLNHISKRLGISKHTNSIRKRIEILLQLPIKYTLIKSASYITYKSEVLPLYRGQPLPQFNQKVLFDSVISSLDWLIENMNEDGRFLYYYDPTKDSKIDFEHPNMKNPLYNNILRHSGGTIALIHGYELSQDKKYLVYAKKSLEYLCSTFRTHQYRGERAVYPFFNKKSKLGGVGIGLVAMVNYTVQSKDDFFRQNMDGLVRHILSRIDKEGEMIGYYIHPKYNNGKALINPSNEVKKELFSFYYPGEALLGLALYIKHIKNIDKELKEDILKKAELALDFLINIRPVKYADLFLSLPSDAWLMQAIEEWVEVDGFKKDAYINFSYRDADIMLQKMYTEDNAPYPDYVGGFFYNYGDHVYQDASRCEGIIATYNMAKNLGNEEKAKYYMAHMMKSAHGLMLTRHTEESTYAQKYPKKSINSFRFKLTRSWVRVDSVQHAACFLSRLYDELQKLQIENNK